MQPSSPRIQQTSSSVGLFLQRSPGQSRSRTARSILVTALGLLAATSALAGTIRFHDAAADPATGLEYARTRSTADAIYQGFVSAGVLTIADLFDVPSKWRGSPGVAILDFDDDGDLDIYVTNGPGSANSLFSNQLRETGHLSFVDVAQVAGIEATAQDSSGVCFGDTDNDGDRDLLVLSNFGPNLFFENRGDGTFQDLSVASNLGTDDRDSSSCSFGDIDGDGLLDVVVSNTFDWSSNIAIGLEPFAANDHNQLFHNLGGNAFLDISDASGLTATAGFSPPGFDGSPTISWAVTMVDYDQDGDIDILHADDQAGIPEVSSGGIDRGLLHIFENDGSGSFTDVTSLRQTNRAGCWMGLSVGDLNRDGTLDVFGTNCGPYGRSLFTDANPVYGAFQPFVLGVRASRWLLQQADGTFSDPGVGALVATPFAWSTSLADYDNDGDTDVFFYGDLAFGPLISHENPGGVLENDGSANFRRDGEAFSGSANHLRRHVQGMAIGDLDDNGFPDLISASSHDVQEAIPLSAVGLSLGSDFDNAFYQANFLPTDTFGVWTYSGIPDNVDGSLAVEISGGNRNRWAKVRTRGSVGLTSRGRVNRDGIGAVVSFRPHRGTSAAQPVLGGSSYASQDSLEIGFGLGRAPFGRIDILWPGGVRNRLYRVRHGERILFPEIPVSIDDPTLTLPAYLSRVHQALDDLQAGGVINHRQKARFFISAVLAFLEERA